MQQFEQITLQQSKSYARPPSRTTIMDFKKDTQLLEKLKKQNDYLRGLITRIQDKNNINRPTSAATTKQNNNYLLKQMIATQKGEIQKLDQQITALKKQTWAKKIPEGDAGMQKQLKVLQTRLDKGTHKLNDTLAQINKLRNLIDNLRRQKAIFQTLYRKLQKQLHEKRKQMANIIQKANHSYEERDKATQFVAEMKQDARKQTFDFQKQLKQLSLLTEKTKIGQYSVSTRRPLSSQQTVERPRTASKKKQNPANLKKLQKLRDDFKKITGATQIQNFTELIKIFKKNQEQNFKTFRTLNQKAYQIQQLQHQLSDLNKQIKGLALNQNQPDKRMQQVTKKLQNAEQKQSQIYGQYRQSSNNIASLLNYVQKMYVAIYKPNEIISITQTNVMTFLEKIQQKTGVIQKLHKQLTKSNQNKIVADTPKHQQDPLLKGFMFDNYLDQQQQYDKILTHQDFMKKANERFASKSRGKQQKHRRK